MFTVKATYRGETRKFTFPDNYFPSFDQLCNQLYRVFPSSNDIYLSRLLFSPDTSQSSRILIGQAVHSAEEYEMCILPHKHRRWTDALLRFSVLDATPHKVPYAAPETTPAQPLASDSWFTQGSTLDAGLSPIGAEASPPPPPPMSQFRLVSSPYVPPLPPLPPPRPMFTTPPRAFTEDLMSDDPTPLNQFIPPPPPLLPPRQPFQSQSTPYFRSASPCCSVSQGKTEIRHLVYDLQRQLRKFEETLTTTFGTQFLRSLPATSMQSDPTALPGHNSSPFWLLPVLCASCSKNVAVLHQYTCENCRTVLCFECYMSGKSGFCPSSLGSHLMKETSRDMDSPPPTPVSYPLPPAPSWLPRAWGPPTPPAPYQAHPWSSSSGGPPHSSSWMPSWQVMPPGAPSMAYPFQRYATPLPFIPPPSSSARSPWSPMRPLSPAVPHPPSNVSPPPMPARASEPAQVPGPAATPTPPPRPPIHRGVICDMCDHEIEGLRHKCLDCRDYDLCTVCISSGSAERHNPFHEFLEINEPGRVVVHTLDLPNSGPTSANVPSPPSGAATVQTTVHSARCNLCDSRIQGYRYKCVICPDFDTCSSCFGITQEQHPGHSFIKLSKTDDYIPRDFGYLPQHNATCDACDNPIHGVRFKCMHPDCPDFDLCEGCEAHPIPMHPDRHPLLKIRLPETVIPKLRSGFEQQARSTSPISNSVAPGRSDDYEHGHIHNPSVSSPEYIIPPAIPRLDTPPNFSSGLTTLPYSTSEPSRDFQDQSSCRMRTPYNPCWYPAPSSAPFVNHILPLGAGPSVFIPQPSDRDPAEFSDSSRSTSPGTFIWQSPVRGKPVLKAPEAPAVQNFHSAAPSSTWVLPSHELNHLIKGHSLSPAEPKTNYEESPGIANGNDPSTRNTPFQSPLGDEALLKRPANLNVESSDIAPVSSANHSLAALLKDYQATSFLSSWSAGVVDDEQETPGGVQKKLTAAFVLDITVPDGQNFPPGAEFVKCWRMINDGERDWPETTELVFVAGTPLLKETSPQSVKVGSIKVGAEIDLWAGELKAPDAPGRYIAYWRLRDDQGQLFGNTIWVEINVIEATHESSDHSLASSSIIMPDHPASQSESTRTDVPTALTAPGSSVTIFSKLRSNSEVSLEDDISDGSSLSVVSAPFSEEEEEDARLWEASRAHVAAVESVAQNMEYVLLYDDNSDED